MARKIEWGKFGVVLVLTIAVFLIGIFLGNFITQLKFDNVSNTEQSLRLEILGMDLESSLIEQNPCLVFNDTDLSKNLDDLGNKVTYLENTKGTNDIDVINMKKEYSLLQIRHFLLEEKATLECNITRNFILYFYSNEAYCLDECKRQGYVITDIRQHDSNLFAYSFDMGLDNPALNTLKLEYDVGNTAPVLVINGVTYNGFQSKDFIEQRIGLINIS